jgi:ribosomal protein S8
MYLKYKSSFTLLVSNINNGISARSKTVGVPFCKFNYNILNILCRLGYIESFNKVIYDKKSYFLVFFKFDVNGRQCLQKLRLIRNLERQINLRKALVKDIVRGDKIFTGTWLVSTMFSTVLTDDEALSRNIHGVRFLLIT